jgi:protein TonB
MIGRWRRLQLACVSVCVAALPCWAESNALGQWRQQISDHLRSHQRGVPTEACGKGGEAKVAFKLDRTGKLISSSILAGTGLAVLDKAALELAKDAQPFPPAPPEISDDQLEFSVIFDFAKGSSRACDATRGEERVRSMMHSICRGC